jgi:putative ABC transport system ATP-binding protein
MTTNGFIKLDSLHKSFQEGEHTRRVLVGASAQLRQGEFTAIVGKSGSGKSTLLNLISGIDRPDRGAIWLNGQQLTALDERHRTLFRRQHIGFVFQFFNLIPTLTVWENVILPLELNGVSGDQMAERADALLRAVQLRDRHDSFPDRLSGGERQRVAIARALVHDPLLVLADEPTGNLDGATGQQVLELLDRLTRREGKNLLLVTHGRDGAQLADRVLQLRDGILVDARGHS